MLQMFWLLLHVLILFKTKNKMGTVAAGVALGLFAGVKVGLFVPVIMAADAVWFLKTKRWKWLGLVIAGIGLGYVGSYFFYFWQHPNPIAWVRLHGKVLDFWKTGGQVLVGPLDVFKFMLINKLQSPLEWSPILALGLAVTGWWTIKAKRLFEEKTEWLALAVLILGWVAMCSYISFTPRYLVPIVPILGLMVAGAIGRNKILAWGLILMAVPFYFIGVGANPKEAEANFLRYIATDSYQDSYRLLDKPSFTEKEWVELNRKIKTDNRIWWTAVSKVDGGAEVTWSNNSKNYKYIQKYGVVNENGAWKIDWEWDKNRVAEAKAELMEKSDGLEWRYVWVVPAEIQNWPVTLKRLTEITGLETEVVWNNIKKVVLDKYATPVGWVKDDIKIDEYSDAINDNAVRIENKLKLSSKSWKINDNELPARWLELE